jgi:uncharacterized membrane protein
MLPTTILFVFSVFGLADTAYLSYHAATKTPVSCWFFPEAWCHKVQFSKFSRTLGIPNAYLGLLMYMAILILTYLAAAGFVAPWIVKAVVIFGFGFSMYFTFIQAFVLRAFCTWCVVSAINFTVMFAAVLLK